MSIGFRDQFKIHKSKRSLSEVEKIIDFNDPEAIENKKVKPVLLSNSVFPWAKTLGMKNPRDWKAYTILNKPGLIVIKNPFHCSGQRYWVIRCLKYYTRKPNKLNIDAHCVIDSNEDWWEYCLRMENTDKGTSTLKKLRWATLGYHHNWDTKVYSESSKSEFPYDLQMLCCKVGEVFTFLNFNAEAAIINIYHFGSTLSGHVDHSEVNLDAPLFSFSFGQSAIFLIGGKTLDDEAFPILIESGDIVIMSGESRLCYHGVPRIFPAKSEPWNDESNLNFEMDPGYLMEEVVKETSNSKSWAPFNHFLSQSRINMNIRQVLHSSQNILTSVV